MRESPGSRLVVNEIVCGSSALLPVVTAKASSPSRHIPANQSALAETANLMAMNAFSIFGGCERTYSEFEEILKAGGLEIAKFYQFRTFTAHLECRLLGVNSLEN